jgi:outer membrane protein OmpA-like peptidoglycan-associated protein
MTTTNTRLLRRLRTVLAALATLSMFAFAGCAADSEAKRPPSETGTGSGVTPTGALTADQEQACQSVFSRTEEVAASDSLVVVVDRTASMADTPIPASLSEDIERVSLADGTISVIAVDGVDTAPRLIAKDYPLGAPGDRDTPLVRNAAAAMPSCVAELLLTQAAPTSPGSDLYRAMSLAAQVASPESRIWTLSDLQSNVGQANLADAALLRLSPIDAAARISQAAPLDLAGTTWHLPQVGASSTYLVPQSSSWLREFAAALCGSWGAGGCDDIAIDPVNPVRSDGVDLPSDPVLPFPMPVTNTAAGCEITLPGDSIFAGGSAALSAGAADQLAESLAMLGQFAGAPIIVKGHTASLAGSDDQAGVEFSRLRAEVVANFLRDSGVTNPIDVVGVGDHEPLAEDLDSSGRQVESVARAERRVTITLAGVPCAG